MGKQNIECVFYGDCQYNFSECEEDTPNHRCKKRIIKNEIIEDENMYNLQAKKDGLWIEYKKSGKKFVVRLNADEEGSFLNILWQHLYNIKNK